MYILMEKKGIGILLSVFLIHTLTKKRKKQTRGKVNQYTFVDKKYHNMDDYRKKIWTNKPTSLNYTVGYNAKELNAEEDDPVREYKCYKCGNKLFSSVDYKKDVWEGLEIDKLNQYINKKNNDLVLAGQNYSYINDPNLMTFSKGIGIIEEEKKILGIKIYRVKCSQCKKLVANKINNNYKVEEVILYLQNKEKEHKQIASWYYYEVPNQKYFFEKNKKNIQNYMTQGKYAIALKSYKGLPNYFDKQNKYEDYMSKDLNQIANEFKKKEDYENSLKALGMIKQYDPTYDNIDNLIDEVNKKIKEKKELKKKKHKNALKNPNNKE